MFRKEPRKGMRMAEMEATAVWDVRRQILMRQLWAARGDADQTDAVWVSIRKFNEEARKGPAAGKQITVESVDRSFATRARAADAREAGMPRVGADVPIVQDIQRLFPNAEVDIRRTR